MDAYQQQQHSRYMRPPQPPLPPDPHHSYLHHQHPRPPVPPQATWYSNQFQFHPQPPSSHSPPTQQWPAPPPPSSSYPAHPPPPPPMHPYPSHHQFAPPLPPQVPTHSHLPQSYPQEWGNPNWGQHQHQPQQQQGWDYQATNNTEDWGARARAWAAQKAATEDQYLQSQISQVGRTEEQNQFHEQYPHSTDSHYQDFPQQQYSAPGYHQFPVSAAAPSHQATISYLQDNASFGSGPSNVSDGRMPYAFGNGVSAGAPTTSPSVLPQEVPSSYSSVAGKEEAIDKKEELYKSLPLASTHEGQHHMQPSVPAFGGSVLTEQPFAYGSQGADPTADLSNQPLDFTPRFTCDQDPHMQSNYAAHHDSLGSTRGLAPVTPLPSASPWTPAAATGAAYPSVPPGLPSGHQNEPSVAMPSPVSGHNAPPFGSFPAPSFQPTISASSMSYSLGPGSSLSPTTGFQGDAYGISNITERPKKASVPNWLKEEIIKNASVITRSSFEHAKEETQSVEDEGVDRSFEKSGQADSKSIDSSRSTEEEDEDEEDDEDVARAAAINQEIKRVLTEILLKVTDDLFDEIATKVLDEDGPTVEVEHNADSGNRKVSPSSPEAPTPKASAKVLVPVKAKEPEGEDASEKSSSSAPGNVLGLANYASDDDEDDEIRSSSLSNFRKNEVLQQSKISKFSKDTNHVVENGSPPRECQKDSKMTCPKTDMSKTSSADSKNQINAAFSDLSEHKYSSQMPLRARDIENSANGRTIVPTNNESGTEVAVALEQNAADDSLDKANRMKSDENNRHEGKRNNSGKDIKDAELRSREDEKGDGIQRKHDEIHLTKEKKDDRSGLRERMKEQSDGTGERVNEFSSKKKSHLDAEDEKRELEKRHRSRGKEDAKRKRSQTKDKEEDRARRNTDSGRHKRRRSSSTSSKGRNSKDKDDSSDEASDDMKRKKHSRKRNLSPSPVRSRRRQVSRSPHSKHSQRRHSPYSSLETTRKKRSRSRSPVRRHR